MKVKDEFIVRKIGSKYYAVSAARIAAGGGMIALNETGAFLWERLASETDAEALAKALAEKYDLENESAMQDVEAFVNMLKEVDALA